VVWASRCCTARSSRSASSLACWASARCRATDDDLSQIELTGSDLVGILWSEHGTRWPGGTDMEELRARSQETSPDSGVYVVTGPPRVGARQ
jgi:hypothetical protein